MDPWMTPSLIDFSITGECNLSCQICNLKPKNTISLDTPTILEIISHLDEIYVNIIDITGGEPLMRRDWFSIVEHVACNTDLALVLSTNGTLWNDSDIRRMAELPGDIMVVVSVDGATSDIHGQIRAPGRERTWERLYLKTLETVQGLVDHNVGMCVNIVLNSLNVHGVFDLYHVLRDMGVSSLNVIRFYPAGIGFGNREKLEIPYKAWAAFVQQTADFCMQTDEFGSITILTHFWEIFLPLCEIYGEKNALELTKKIAHPCSGPLESSYRKALTSMGCNAGITHAFIDSDGCLYPCGLIPRYEEVNCGNIAEAGFDAVWFDSSTLRRIRSAHAEDVLGCRGCEYLTLCGGGCRGRALALSGDFLGPDLACPKCKEVLII
ncbi:MAG: radical SAM protein [Theionarchaea archaeon]|nr:radical SAM protein [Theionarchaea archaeon]MBU7020960.1 radical SAM protein [Theionarchaea archaeon]